MWEQWRQTWKGLLLLAASLALFAFLTWQFHSLILYIFAKNGNLMVGTAYLPALGAAALLFLQENRGRVGFGYPRRMLVLPARTFILVGSPLLYRLAVVALFALGAGLISGHLVKELYYISPAIILLMIAVAAIHAAIFLVTGYGAATGFTVLLLCVLATSPLLGYVYEGLATTLSIPRILRRNGFTPPELNPRMYWAGAMCIVFWFFAAYWGARRARSEVAEDPVGLLVRKVQHAAHLGGGDDEFKSADQAQVWFEWGRGLYLFPWLSLGLGLLLALTFRMTSAGPETRFLLVAYLLAVAPAIIACLLGYTITRSSNDYNWFIGARPLSTRVIAKARLVAGMKAVGFGYVLLLIAFLISYRVFFPKEAMLQSLVRDLRVMTSSDGSMGEGLVLVALMAIVSILASWSLLWIARAAGVLVWLAGVAVAGWFYFFSGGRVYQFTEGATVVTPTEIFIKGMSYFLGAVIVITLATAIRRRMVAPIALGICSVIWLALLLAARSVSDDVDFGNPVMTAVWLSLPFVPLASIPITLEWQRHR
jgi:hypothetical protein